MKIKTFVFGTLVLSSACTPTSEPIVDDGIAPLSAAVMDSILSATGADSLAAPTFVSSPDTLISLNATLAQIGYEEGIALNGAVDAASITIPVNRGQRATELVLDLMPTPMMPSATLILRQGNRVLAQRLVTDTTTSVRLPLNQALVSNDNAVVSLGVNVPGRDACEAPLFYRTILEPSGRVEYSGTPTATGAINGFFPARLDTVTFYLPEQPSLDAAQAALDAAAFVARRYRGDATVYRIAALPDDGVALAEPNWNSRAIVWASDGPTRVLSVPGGRGTVLAIASRRDSRQLFTIEQGPEMVPSNGLSATTVRLDDRVVGSTTLDDLGFGSRTIQGSAITTSGYRFSLADFGRTSSPRAFRLVARHSTPPEGLSGEVAVLLNGSLVWSSPMAQSNIDVAINLPPHLLSRDNLLEVRFLMRLAEGECRLGAPLFTATIDGSSSFLTEADLPMAPSFDRFPAAMLPTFSILLEPRDRFRVELAATAIEEMQRTTSTPLAPFLVRDLDEARGAILAVGTGGTAAELDAPLSTDGFRLTDIDNRVWDEYRPTESYAAMQAFERGGRDILLLHHTGGDGSTLDALIRETMVPYGWFGLHGDLAVRGPNGPATVVTAANSGWRVETISSTTISSLERWRSAIFAGAAVLLLGLLIWWYPRVVRRDLDQTG